MMKKMIFNLQFKIFLLFIIISTISTTISFGIVTKFNGNHIYYENVNAQTSISNSIQTLVDNTELPLDEALNLIENPLYTISLNSKDEILQKSSNLFFTKSQVDNFHTYFEDFFLSNDNSMMYTSKTHFPISILRFGDDFVSIYFDNTFARTMVVRALFFSSILSIIVGIFLTIFGSLFLSKPISRLSEGLKKVTEGNFDTVLEDINSNDEIGFMTKQFNKMVKELKSNIYLKQDFINNISHELKTPLTSIKGYADLLMRKDIDDTQRLEYATTISDEAKRLSDLSIDILNLSKLRNQELLDNLEKLNLSECIRQVLVLLEPQWASKNLELDLDFEEFYIYGNLELLRQAFINLLSNAIKFSYDNSLLTIKIRPDNDNICIIIKDEGIGMDQETVSRVFEDFYQGDVSRNSLGHGLGLSIVKRIVTLHKGEITVDSKVNIGTTIILDLPLST